MDKQAQLILIVDDNITNLKVAIENLQADGLEVITARSGEGGLQRAAFARPDLILLDVRLPGIDGFEVCRRLKADPTTQAIPVIFMTALADVEDKLRGFAAGGVDYITKPIQVEEMQARVNTHLTIRALQKNLEDKVAELDAFAYTVAHDLKNPLTRIVAGLDLLTENTKAILSDEAKELLKICLRGSWDLTKVVDALLLMARLRQGEVATYSLEMAEHVQRVCRRLSHLVAEYQAELHFPDSWLVAQGYGPWVEEVWANYLSNGLKYGGRPPILHFGSSQQSDGFIRFWVQDNGPGLSPDEQARLFTEFTRLHQLRAEGHGLGLSIVQRIVRKLGGQTGVESQVGQGSTFYFTLPPENDDK